MIDSEKLEVK